MSDSFLILHGLNGSGPGHWQSWLAERLSEQGYPVRFPKLPSPSAPQRAEWLATLRGELEAFDDISNVTVVCHSLAAVLWLHHAERGRFPPVDRALLVAPPGQRCRIPELASFFPVPLNPDAVCRAARSTELICSDADPYCPEKASICYGGALEIETTLLRPQAAHINIDSGFGAWQWIEEKCLESNLVAARTSRFF